MTSNNRFVARMISILVVAFICTALWTTASDAAQTSTREFGHCVTTEVLVTDRKTGEQHIAVKTVCECSEQNPCTSKVASR